MATFFVLNIIVCFTCAGAGIWPADRPTHQGDLSGSELTRLYNSRVDYAEYWNRLLTSGKKRLYFPDGFVHAGVLVHTNYNGGTKWLIHKGNDYGDASSTVIVRASAMSSEWYHGECGYGFVYGHTVDDFMKKAYVDDNYQLLSVNCQTAAHRMWELVSGGSC